MKQITEDYVSFETAKLLKEKGVDFIACVTYYCEDKPTEVYYSFCGETNSTWEKRCCQAPTHQMALKYLREVHKIHINLDIHWLHFANQNGWMYVIERILDNGVDYIDSKGDENDATFFSTHEKACEAALLYVLKNLI